jgi:hypothetical protein
MTWRRTRIVTDVYGAPCSCLECQAAGVTQLRIVKVPPDDWCRQWHWLHGTALRAWYDARDRGIAAARAALNRGTS